MAGLLKEHFIQLLMARRRTMSKGMRAKTRNVKMPLSLYPYAAEKAMAKWIASIAIIPLADTLDRELTEQGYSRWLKDAGIMDSNSIGSIRVDGYGDEINRVIGKLKFALLGMYPEGANTAKDKLTDTAYDVFNFNQKQADKQTEKVLGYKYASDDAWWKTAKEAWEAENYNLITGLSEEYIKKINDVAYTAVRTGQTWGTLKKELKGMTDKMTGSKARLIARDQVGKLNGQLTKARQQDLGIETYYWETSKDERVRGNPAGKYPKAIPSHWIMQGKLCRWDDGTVYSDDNGKTWKPRTGVMPMGIPGEEIACRCTALANMEPLLNEADERIE